MALLTISPLNIQSTPALRGSIPQIQEQLQNFSAHPQPMVLPLQLMIAHSGHRN